MSESEEERESILGLCGGFKKPGKAAASEQSADKSPAQNQNRSVNQAANKQPASKQPANKTASPNEVQQKASRSETTPKSFRIKRSSDSDAESEKRPSTKKPASKLLQNSSWKMPVEEEEEEIALPTAEELEAIRKSAYDEGFESGKAQGLKSGYDQGIKNGQQEIDATMARLKQVMQALYEPIHQQDEALESVLLDSVISICRLILKRELKIDSSQIDTILRSAIDSLGVGYKNLKIHLHPRDAELISDKLKGFSDYNSEWRIIEHPTLSPGGCIVETDTSLLNATVDQRVKQVVQQIYDQEVLRLPGHADEILMKEKRFISDSFADLAEEIAEESRVLPASQDPLTDTNLDSDKGGPSDEQ